MERTGILKTLGYLGVVVLLVGTFNLGGAVHAGEVWLGDAALQQNAITADSASPDKEASPNKGRRPNDGDDDDDDDDGTNGGDDATPIGAWFGVARPCTPPAFGVPIGSTDDYPDETICKLACNGEACAPNGFPFLEVTMIPTLLADGTVLADDFAELLDGHTTAQGKWKFHGQTMVDGKLLDEYRATFIWFNGALPDFGLNNAFVGVARPRFVTFFDKDDPDVMRGYIQPYLYPLTEPSPDGIGIVRLKPGTPFPHPSPTDPLPEVCDPTDATAMVPCLGTLHFYIKRIPAS